jgi:hypothetical protein
MSGSLWQLLKLHVVAFIVCSVDMVAERRQCEVSGTAVLVTGFNDVSVCQKVFLCLKKIMIICCQCDVNLQVLQKNCLCKI